MLVDHTLNDMSVFQMLLDRLPFLVNDYVAVPTEEIPQGVNALISSRFTFEVMTDLQCCLNIDPEEGVGIETNYSQAELSLIADIVTLHFLLRLSLINTDGTAEEVASSTFLKKAKAGSTEVEYAQIDVKNEAAGKLTLDGLFDKFTSSAVRRGRKLGCLFQILPDASIEWYMGDVLPFSTDFSSYCC